MTTCLGKSCSFGLLCVALSICVCSSFPFGFEGGIFLLPMHRQAFAIQARPYLSNNLSHRVKVCNNNHCITIHRYPIFSMRYSIMCRVYTGYHGISETEHGLYACTVDHSLAKARGLSL